VTSPDHTPTPTLPCKLVREVCARGRGILALLGIVLAACSGGGPANYAWTHPATRAVEAWAAFPVDVSPRPVVLIGDPVSGPRGFATDDQKVAFAAGAIDRPAHLPVGPDTADGYQIVSADRAFALLRSSVAKVSGVATKTRLTITDVRLGKDTFETDRNTLPMPAWLFTVSGADVPVGVLAVAPEAQWFPSGLVPGRGGEQYWAGAVVAKDHRTLTLSLIGAQADGPCGVQYEIGLTEFRTAVMLTKTDHPNQSTPAANGTPVACDLVGHVRTAPAVLRTPLGARVLIDDLGYPIGVGGTP
jgi:hypothetical protein